MDVAFILAIASIILSAFTILVSAVVTYKSTTGAVKNANDQALKFLENELAQNAYISSKRADIKFDLCQKLNQKCGEIYYCMQRLIPDDLSSIQINYHEKVDINELALRLQELEIEINTSRPFISSDVIELYEELSEKGERFIGAWWRFSDFSDDSTKEGRKIKDARKNAAYEERKSFMKKWQYACKHVNKYLLNNDAVQYVKEKDKE